MVMHDDVLGRILTILKQDDYYRTLEELPVINGLTIYDDIQLFPELYDTTTIIERVTGEADLIERQLRQPGMYPLPKTPLPSISGFVPRPTPTFQPIAPDASPEPVNTHRTDKQQDAETSSDSSLPCRQRTPIGSTSINSTPSQHTPPQLVVPPQPATSQSHNSNNTPTHTQPQKTPQSSSTTQSKQQSPFGTNTNPATQPSIPAAESHQPVSSSPSQHIPKSANGEGVKSSKPEQIQCTRWMTLLPLQATRSPQERLPRATVLLQMQNKGAFYLQGALLNSRATGQIMKDTNFERKQKATAMKPAEKSGKGHRINHSSHIRTTDVSTVLVITKLMIAP